MLDLTLVGSNRLKRKTGRQLESGGQKIIRRSLHVVRDDGKLKTHSVSNLQIDSETSSERRLIALIGSLKKI